MEPQDQIMQAAIIPHVFTAWTEQPPPPDLSTISEELSAIITEVKNATPQNLPSQTISLLSSGLRDTLSKIPRKEQRLYRLYTEIRVVLRLQTESGHNDAARLERWLEKRIDQIHCTLAPQINATARSLVFRAMDTQEDADELANDVLKVNLRWEACHELLGLHTHPNLGSFLRGSVHLRWREILRKQGQEQRLEYLLDLNNDPRNNASRCVSDIEAYRRWQESQHDDSFLLNLERLETLEKCLEQKIDQANDGSKEKEVWQRLRNHVLIVKAWDQEAKLTYAILAQMLDVSIPTIYSDRAKLCQLVQNEELLTG